MGKKAKATKTAVRKGTPAEKPKKWLRIEYRVQVDADIDEEEVDTDLQALFDEAINDPRTSLDDSAPRIEYHDHGGLYVLKDKQDF